MWRLYEFLASVAGGSAFPFLRLAAAAGSETWQERLALAPSDHGPEPPLWCHAASVGEVESLLPVMAEIGRRTPAVTLLLTTVTRTGRDAARRRATGASCRIMPLDVPWLVDRALAHTRPRGIILAETELWPAFIAGARRRGIPLALVNGRISPRGHRRYRLIRPLLRELLPTFRLLAMQSEGDRDRILDLGAPPSVVVVAGNTKADVTPGPLPPEERIRERSRWGIPPDAVVLVAGSVRPEEVGIVLEAFRRAAARCPHLRLLIAPRHLDRVPALERELARRGLRWRRRSDGAPAGAPGEGEVAEPLSWQALLLDSMGELAHAYALGEIAFVGGTLHARYGGHNPLEPASRGIPVLVGPHWRNCVDVVKRLLEVGGACEAQGVEELERALVTWVADPASRERAGSAAVRGADSLRGVASRTVDLLARVGFPW